MYIDKYKKEDGYYDEDDVFYGDAKEFYQTKIFGFCGCGLPEENLEYIHDGLTHIGAERPEHDGWDVWYKKWIEEGAVIFGNESSRYFFFYWCDTQELTEHGGSVPGWLTEKGKQVLADLREICYS